MAVKPLPDKREIAALPPDGGAEFNRLIFETSPYLLQHARNPVDWYPWGEEAFARARAGDKPLLVSLGYSTCHWCHVMERESYESQAVARVLNEHYVAVKVDREERPDLDDIYLLATQLLTGTGGWPNNVWLTPEGKPWYAGTYFPPEDRHGHPGFISLLTRLAETWRTRREEVEHTAAQLTEAMERTEHAPAGGPEELSDDLLQNALVELGAAYDEQGGGFGPAPKFPPHTILSFLLQRNAAQPDAAVSRLLLGSLDAMVRGGIRDHIGGGFFRYSTDERWFVPHFEKMLYDNAQMARNYALAYRQTGHPDYREAARETCDWALRRLGDPGGAFYAALDADSEGEEGKYYLWSVLEIREVLGANEGDFFCELFDLSSAGNFSDETGRPTGRSLPHLPTPLAVVAAERRVPEIELRRRLYEDRLALLERRRRRVHPGRDEKILLGWNGLMIRGLVAVGDCLREPAYLQSAVGAAEFLLRKLRPEGRFLRVYARGQAKLAPFLDDLVFLAAGLLDLSALASHDPKWLEEAQQLMDLVLEEYADTKPGGFFLTPRLYESLLLRPKRLYDEALPSGNGLGVEVLLRLHQRTGEKRYLHAADRALQAFSGVLRNSPRAVGSLLEALSLRLQMAAGDLAGASLTAVGPTAHEQADASATRFPVQAELFLAGDRVAPGERVAWALRLVIRLGWHLSAHVSNSPHPYPTSVKLEGPDAVRLEAVLYPGDLELPATHPQAGLLVYRDEAWITGELAVAAGTAPGTPSLTLVVGLQACAQGNCLQPEEMTLLVPLRVALGASRQRHQVLFRRLVSARDSARGRLVVA